MGQIVKERSMEKTTRKNWSVRCKKGGRGMGRCLLWGAAVLAALTACFCGYVWVSAPSLDQVNVSPEGYRSTVVDDEGEVILTLMGEGTNRIYAELDEIPKHLQDAVIAIEDERFCEHPGIDWKGIARAAYRNLAAGRLSEGASTITQQLIKNNVFTDWTQEKTVLDKVKRKHRRYAGRRCNGDHQQPGGIRPVSGNAGR